MKKLLVLLGMLTAFAPLATDLYLPAFGAIAADLNTTDAALQLTIALYLLGAAVGQLLYGPLSDRYGRKMPLYAGLWLFTAASVGCALATQVEWLLFMRLLQAVGGSAGTVIARAVVTDVFDHLSAAKALSRMMLVMGAAPILAPLVGAQLFLALGWRSVFWALTLFGALCLWLTYRWLSETHPPAKRSPSGVLAQMKHFITLLVDARFMGLIMTGGFAMAGMFAYIAASPQVFIQLHGVPEAHFGWFFGFNAVGLIAGSQINVRLLRRHPPQRIVKVALTVLLALTWLALLVDLVFTLGLWARAGLLFVSLSSIGLVMPNVAAMAMRNQGARSGQASAMMGFVQFILFGMGAGLVSLLQDGTALPMTLAMALTAVVAWIVGGRAVRRIDTA